ncbi:MAG TPA: MBL fold metallo-hydrolase [Vicinamibacterales bacterium]|jgi:glyoxylase-like metal-dependent hydrolase (beta-lactamase superfamily II)|nr:MBL fold metallo-hydrolase [Vicinamibacterales bacterium]
MRNYIALAVFASVVTAAACGQKSAVQTAADTLKVSTIKTLQVTGSGTNFSVGQNYTSSDAWPPVTVKNYTASIDYDAGSMRTELVRQMGAVMPQGGGAPFFGEQRQNQLVSGNFAWNMGAPGPNGAAPMAQPAPDAAAERMLAVWSTPIGFVKAAMTNNATTTPSGSGTDVSFTVNGKYKMEGTINAQGQVEKVRTWFDQPIVGDMLVETTYSDYKDFGGVTYPSHIVQTQDGFPALDITVSAVTANPAVDIQVPENVRAFQPPPIRVESQKLAEGVYYLTGGTHHSLAIEMADHIVVVDTPNNQARGEAVLAKAKELIPNKPVRFVVTSHHHWDHLGGIRAAIDEGATIVTHQSNEQFLQRVAKTPHTIAPDRQASSNKPVMIQAVGDDGQLTDGKRVIELHRLQGYGHTADMLVVYLPKEKILGEPDAFTPPAQQGASLIPPAVPSAKALNDNIKRLKLDVRTIAPFHGNRTTTVAELEKAAATPAVSTN